MWFILLFLIFVSPIRAQEVTAAASPTTTPVDLFKQYQDDYLYQYNLYQQTYSIYLEKKQVYKKYGTATTQNEKLLAAKETINARNRMFKSYLMALRVMLDVYKTADFSQTETDQNNLKDLEIWFDQQIPIVSAVSNDHDLQSWVNDFVIKYKLIQQSIYTALVQDEANLRWLTLNQSQTLMQNIKNNPHLITDSQQWLQSYTDKSTLTTNAINAAMALTKKNQTGTRFANYYPSAKDNFKLARKNLTGIVGDLKLIIIRFYQP
jgi:hypothetical protein